MDEEQQINDLEKTLLSLTSLVTVLRGKIADANMSIKRADASIIETESIRATLRERIHVVNNAKNDLIAREESVKQREQAQKKIDDLLKRETDLEKAKTDLENERRLFLKQCKVERDTIATQIADIVEAKKKIEEMRVVLEKDRRALEEDKTSFENTKTSLDLASLDTEKDR